MDRPSVAFVITTLDRGGAEVQVAHLARGLHQRGWRVVVVSLAAPRALANDLRSDGVTVRDLGMRPGIPDPRAVSRFRRILREEKVQLMHAHMFHAVLLARLARPGPCPPPLVSTFHNIRDGGRIRSLAYRITDRLSTVDTAVSKAVAMSVHSRGAVPARRAIEVVPNGVPVGAEGSDTPSGGMFRWICVGSLTEQKDHRTLLEAFALIARSSPVRLTIVGAGPLEWSIRDTVRVLDLESTVEMLGPREDVAVLLRRADAMVLASRWEGFPMVLLEAGAAGLPVVATAVGGSPEIVEEGETGFLVGEGDPVALADAMTRMVCLQEIERKAMGRAAKTLVTSRFGIESVVDRWEALYEAIIDGRRTTPPSA